MEQLLTELRARALRHARTDVVESIVPRVFVGRNCGGTRPIPTLYEPMLVVVLQGAKRVMIGDRELRYDESTYFVASVDLPATGHVIESSPEKPFLGLGLKIDPEKVAALLPAALDAREPNEPAFGVSPITSEMLEIWLRIVRLLDAPDDVATLAPLMEQELLYRMLRGPQGGVLRQFARADSRLSRVRRSIAEIRAAYDKPLRVEELAERAGMSPASFHRHFKAATAMSPLQYQKRLRLQRARNLLLANEEASRAGFAVGYESASQFSREYARLFGAPPARDAARVRAAGEISA